MTALTLNASPSFKVPSFVTGLVSPVLVIGLWWGLAASGLFPSQVLVSPDRVFTALLGVWETGELQQHLGATFYRLGVGFGAGTLIGLVYGVAAALFRSLEDYTLPFFTVIRTVPTIAFVPILILFFGIGETFKILIVAKATFFPIALAAIEGVRGIPKRYVDVADAWRLPLFARLKHVVIPAALPDVVTGVRLGLGRSWGALVAAELIASEAGLGQMMELGRQMLRLDIVFVGVVISGLVGFGLDKVLRGFEAHLSRWKAS